MTIFVMYMNITVYHYYSMYYVEQLAMTVLDDLFDIIHAVIMIDCNVHVHHKYCHSELFDTLHAVIMIDCNVHVHHKYYVHEHYSLSLLQHVGCRTGRNDSIGDVHEHYSLSLLQHVGCRTSRYDSICNVHETVIASCSTSYML
jgi:hypothetical protein